MPRIHIYYFLIILMVPVLLCCSLPGSSGKIPDDVKLIQNGDFSKGTSGWFVWGNDAGAAVMSVENGELRIDISNPGPHQWSIGLGRSGFKI